jgi:Tfp pilus assembly protein PilN
MLRTNLSTRPFYNVRTVQLTLGLLATLVVAITLFNVVEVVRLTASQRSLGASAARAEDEAERLRAEAAQIRAQINPEELQVVAEAAREANVIIDRRAFSWTELFAKLEATLPPDVRITAIRPRLEDNAFTVSIGVEARQAEDLDAFMEALETDGGFRNVLDVAEQTNDEGLLQAIVEGIYVAPPREGEPAAAEGTKR